MATPAGVSKLDMSLDEIIKLNKKQKSKPKSKGPPARAQGQSSDGQKGGRGGKPSGATVKPKLKLSLSKIRQKAKRTQTSVPSYSGTKSKAGNASRNRQHPTPSQNVQSTGIKSRLGVKVKGKQGFTSQGQNRGGKSPGRGGQRPGAGLKMIRELKSAKGNPSKRRQGNAAFKRMAAQGEVKQVNKKQAISKGRKTSNVTNNSRASGQGGRGKGNRGKGPKKGSPARDSQPSSSRSSPEYSPKPPVRGPRPLPFDPPGVDLPLRICVDHHTSQPLHRRFTPQLEGQNTQRLVQKGGRTINYSK